MVTNDTGMESLSENDPPLPICSAYKLRVDVANCWPRVWGRPLTSPALEGFGKGNFPDSCADNVHGPEGSLCASLTTLARWCRQQ